jgi:Tfp pilus assembly protein PilX
MNRRAQSRARRESGVVLIFTLIILLILTIGAVALIRSTNTALFNAGNLAFRRDLVNQSELVVSNVNKLFQSGALSTSASTEINVPAQNYYATMLATNAQGIPNALLVQNPANPVAGATSDVKMYYVIDRLCQNTGLPIVTQCVESSAAPSGGTAKPTAAVAPPSATVYRLSVRVDGPRNTQVFTQTTLTRPN